VAALWGHGELSAQELVDRIVAVVDKDPIFLSDVDAALAEDLYVRSMRGEVVPEDSAELEAMKLDVLESIIDRMIVIVKAREVGIEVTRTDVEDALDQWLSDMIRAAGSEAAFMSELERQGIKLKDFKARYRKDVEEQLLVTRFMRSQLTDISVSDSDVSRFYETKYDSIPELPEVVGIAHIIIVPRMSGEREDRILAKVDRVMERIRAGEPFDAVAREMSEDALTSGKGGVIGEVTLGDLREEIANIAAGLEEGEVSEPIRTRHGVEIVKVDTKEDDKYKLSHIFINLRPQKEDTLAAWTLADEVRARAMAGESFEALARQFSDDPETRENGGYVGEIEVTALDDNYRENLKDMSPGEISGVIRTGRGFQILKLVSRAASRKAGFDEAKDWIRNVLAARRREALFAEWLDGAREEIHVRKYEF
jgi:peptidyl-prolyl cis-trans isomerase SurA